MTRVLIAEDNRNQVDTLLLLLADKYEVVAAFDAETALDIARDFQPQIALLDILLPGMSGIELLNPLRQVSPDTVPIMLTIVDRAMPAVDALRSGALFYLVKPFDEEELLRALEKAGDEWHRRSKRIDLGTTPTCDLPVFHGMVQHLNRIQYVFGVE